MSSARRKQSGSEAGDKSESSTKDPSTAKLIPKLTKRYGEKVAKDELHEDRSRKVEAKACIVDFIAAVDGASGERLKQLHMGLALAWAILSKPKWPPAAEEDRFDQRSDYFESAPDFIRSRYGHLLNGTFSRVDLAEIDPSLVKGLRSWETRNHKLSLEELNLPTGSDANTMLIESGLLDSELAQEIFRIMTVERTRARRPILKPTAK